MLSFGGVDVTSGSGGFGAGNGRHRGRFAEHAKPLAAVLTGVAALLAAVAGMVTLLCSDPDGNPPAVVATTVAGGAPDTSVSADPATPSPAATPTPTPTPTSSDSSAPTPPAPQWEGDIQVDSLGESLATVPPRPIQSGDPDISAGSGGTFFARLGAAEWTSGEAPSPEACATLITVRTATRVTAEVGTVYCVRVAHSPIDPGSQYAAVRVLGQGRDSANYPYVRIHATVWPDQE
jgi:hypothetical protein